MSSIILRFVFVLKDLQETPLQAVARHLQVRINEFEISWIALNVFLIRLLRLTVIQAVEATDPCNPSPCGANAQCRNGICTCLPEYEGDPYTSCRPECVLNSDCPKTRACLRNKCKDPCAGTCGSNAICEVINHIPSCSCPERTTGNPFVSCSPVQGNFYGKITLISAAAITLPFFKAIKKLCS